MFVPERAPTIAGYLVVLIVVGVWPLLILWSLAGHGTSLSRLNQVRPGMTSQQAIAVLGQPHTSDHASDGSEAWFYTRWTLCQVKLFISPQGRVSATEHDH